MLQQLLSILTFCTLPLAAFGLGRPIVRGLGVGREDRLSTAVWSIALGLVAAGLFLTALGLVGGLYVPVIGVMTIAAACWGVRELLRDYRAADEMRTDTSGWEDPEQSPPTAWTPPPTWLSVAILAAAGLACAGSLLGALAPPTAGDALCYHLQLPKAFLAQHGFAHLPYDPNSTFPLLTEMWFLWGLAIDGGVCAQLVHWGIGLLLGLATVVLATPLLGRRWAWIAGAVVVLTPGITNQMTAPLNDVALAAFTTLTLAAWYRAAIEEKNRRWFVVAGLTAGAALSIKYIAGVFAVAVAVTWLWAIVWRPQRRLFLLQGAAIVAVIAASVGGTWYLRAAWYRGNPVYPFLGEVFSDGNDPVEDGRETLPQRKSPLGRSPLAMVTAPWQVTMHADRFGGRGHRLGVLLLAAVPGLLFCRRLRGLGMLVTVAFVYCAVWFLLRQNVRFLFPAVSPLAVAAVWVWMEMRRFRPAPRWIAGAAFAVAILAMAVVPLRRARSKLAVAVGLQQRADYLLEHEPTWKAAAVANETLPPDAHILSQDHRQFYFNCRTTRESIYRHATHYDRDLADPGRLGRELREAGFTHLLLAEVVDGRGITYDSTLRRLADAQLAGDAAGELTVLTDYRFHDSEGAVRRYRLVALE